MIKYFTLITNLYILFFKYVDEKLSGSERVKKDKKEFLN